ncbi:MAG: ComF family protein [Prevotellaceae bacterium]|jgi:ComF family protein|nr:ComF family protein [Prevotellaceae bacterium]
MSILRHLWRLIYPKLCEACDEQLGVHERIICSSCLYHLPRTGYWNEPGNPIEQLFWERVQVEHACALFFFKQGNRYRRLLYKLKYEGHREIGIRLGELLGEELKKAPSYQAIEVIVPVPLHPKKQYQRGYNQSELIAEGIAKVTGWKVNTTALSRRINTDTQIRKSQWERLGNVSNAFHLNSPDAMKDKHILLIDDVLTTGATLEACAVELQKATGCKINIAVIAFAG